MRKIRLGLIGCGERGTSLGGGEVARLAEYVELIAVADPNTVRLNLAQKRLGATYAYTDYRDLLKNGDVDACIVATPDWTHAGIVVDALASGKDVYCEKVMATTLSDINRIWTAASRSNQLLYVGHNARWGSATRKLHEIVSSGEVGRVVHVWNKRFVEGSKYWHRWHRESRFSGGLLLHKGSHQLDLLNWFAGSNPRRVMATAGLDVYATRTPAPSDRCLNCSEKATCLEYLDITKGSLKAMYLDAEHEDGYIRDQCVFGPMSDVYDNAIVNVEYANGVRGNYTEIHFAPIGDSQSETGVIGDRGIAISRGRQVILEKKPSRERLTFDVVREEGGHGGADFGVIHDFVLAMRKEKPPLTGVEQGWNSAAVGLAANLSIKSSAWVEIDRETRRLVTIERKAPAAS